MRRVTPALKLAALQVPILAPARSSVLDGVEVTGVTQQRGGARSPRRPPPEPLQPDMPQPREVIGVFWCSVVGAAASVAGGLLTYTQVDVIKRSLLVRIGSGELKIGLDRVDAIVASQVKLAGAASVVAAFIWLLLGIYVRRRSQTARWLASLLGVLNAVLFVLGLVAAFDHRVLAASSAGSLGVQAVSSVAGAVGVVLLWRAPTRAWFAAT
jgi:hypothetical protein